MNRRVLRAAIAAPGRDDLDALTALWGDAMTAHSGGAVSDAELARSVRSGTRELLPRLLEDRTVLGARRGQEWVGLCALDLEEGALVGPFVAPSCRRRGLGRRLVAAAERMAVSFQQFRLSVHAFRPTLPFYLACGYSAMAGMGDGTGPRSGLPGQTLRRHFPRRQTRYGRHVRALNRELGLPAQYARAHRMPLQPEAASLVDVGPDIYDRPQRLAPSAAAAWRQLQSAAADAAVTLQLVSGYRSVEYQAGIVRRKQDQGQSIADILAVTAAPGFSEHHTGRALDLTTPGAGVLEENFEDTPAFAWLSANAGRFGFCLSFPRDNRHGLAFEPWHWCHVTP